MTPLTANIPLAPSSNLFSSPSSTTPGGGVLSPSSIGEEGDILSPCQKEGTDVHTALRNDNAPRASRFEGLSLENMEMEETSSQLHTLQVEQAPGCHKWAGKMSSTTTYATSLISALREGIFPCDSGKNGAYFIRNPVVPTENIAVFKPWSHEIGGPVYNALHHLDELYPTRPGFLPGGGALTECVVANYLQRIIPQLPPFLRHTFIIPDTAFAQVSSPQLYLQKSSPLSCTEESLSTPSVRKEGALIQYIPYCTSAKEDPDFFHALQPEKVQALLILQILLLETDASKENLLRTPNGSLVLIDHGYSLPEAGLSGLRSFLLYSKQARAAVGSALKEFVFALSPETLSTSINSILDPLKDKEEAREPIRAFAASDRLRTHRLCLRILQQGLSLGLNLYEIGLLLTQSSPHRIGSDLPVPGNLVFLLTEEAILSVRQEWSSSLAEEAFAQAVERKLQKATAPEASPPSRLQTLLAEYRRGLSAYKKSLTEQNASTEENEYKEMLAYQQAALAIKHRLIPALDFS